MRALRTSFPLTPALSLGERENHSLLTDESDTPDRSCCSRLEQTGSDGSERESRPKKDARWLFPLPEGEGQGEGEGDSKNRVSRTNCVGSTPHGFALALIRRRHWPAVIRRRIWSAFLQRPPNRVADGIFLAPQAGVPESAHLDATRFQKRIAFDIFGMFPRRAVLKAVQFDVHPSFQTEEVKDVRPERMLTAKSVTGESPVVQPTPQKFLGPCVLLAQHACDACELGRCHTCRVGWPQTHSQAPWFWSSADLPVDA